jgi:hypothetical protein
LQTPPVVGQSLEPSRDEQRDVVAQADKNRTNDANAVISNDSLRSAVSFYASFDVRAQGDCGRGDLRLWTRADDPAGNGRKVIRLGYDESAIRVAPDSGVRRGALEFRGRSPHNAFVYFPASGKIAVREGGWGGAVSLWINADLAKIIGTGPWDPLLVVEKSWNDGAVWCDFAPGPAPRDLRIGLFPSVAKDGVPPTLDEGEQIWLRVKSPAFEANRWHHLVQVWDQFDSGKRNAWTSCYLDGKPVGRIEGRDATMAWEIDRVRFQIGSGLIGMIDEVAMFDRALVDDEVTRLYQQPGLVAALTADGD